MPTLSPELKQRLTQIQAYIQSMPSLSTTVTKVMEICNDPNSSPNDLNRVISLDPVLTGSVLRLINSAFYAQRNKVTSLTRAIISLGLNTIKNLVLSTAIVDSISEQGSSAFSMDDFWTHSIGVGVSARLMASKMKFPAGQLEEFFLAGLLHDLGKIPLNNRFADEYGKIIELKEQHGIRLYQAERKIMGIDHSFAGKLIADKWGLDDTMKETIRFHHHPEKAGEDHESLVLIVALADAYVNQIDFDEPQEPGRLDSLPQKLLKRVGITEDALMVLQETVVNEIDEAKTFLNIK